MGHALFILSLESPDSYGKALGFFVFSFVIQVQAICFLSPTVQTADE